jgi:O-antigen ligase
MATLARQLGVRRVTVWGLILVLVAYLVFLGGGFPGIYSVQLRILSLAFVALVLIAWLAWAWRHPVWRPRTVIWPAFTAALLTFGVCTALSPTPRLGLDYLAWSVLLTGLYLLLVRLWTDPFLRLRLGALAVMLCASLCLLYVAVVVVRWANWWTLVGSLRTPPLRPWFEGLTFGNPSAVMTIALLLLAPAIAHLGLGSVSRRIAVVVLAGLVLVVTLFSGSRTGWLALPVAVGITGISWFILPENREEARRLTSMRWVRPGLAVFAGLAAVLVIAFGPGVLGRLGAGGEAGRLTFYGAAIRMFQDSPLHGVGAGGWVADRIAFTPAPEIDYYIPHGHSLYLQTIAEFGLLGIIAGIVVAGSLFWLIAGAVRDPDPIRRRFGWATLFAVVYFGAHQALDFYPNMPAALFAFALPIAWLDGTAKHPMFGGHVDVRGTIRRASSRILVAGLAASVAFLAWSESQAVAGASAVDAADHENWPVALERAKAAVAGDPGMPPYQFTLGLAAANMGELPLAAAAFEHSARSDDFPMAWLDLAAIRLEQGDEVSARDALTRALRLGVQQPAIDVAAAALHLQLGDVPSASNDLVQAITRAPSLAGDPSWATDPDFALLWPDVLQRAIASSDPTTAWEIALVSGDPARAAEIAGRLAPADRDLALLVIPAWRGDTPAILALRARASSRPLDIPTVSWCARVAARDGDRAAAARYRDWASTIDGYSGATAAEMRVVAHLVPGDPIAGVSGSFYGVYTYRRPTPIDQLAPGLPRLTYR